MLDLVKDIFFINQTEAVQYACARVIKRCTESAELAHHATEVRAAILKELVAKLKACNPKKHDSVVCEDEGSVNSGFEGDKRMISLMLSNRMDTNLSQLCRDSSSCSCSSTCLPLSM